MNQAIASTLLAARPGMQRVNPAFAVALRAGQCAQRIAEGFLAADSGLRTLARHAPERFENCDWQGCQFDTDEACELRQRELNSTVRELNERFGQELRHAEFWVELRRQFLSLIDGVPDATWSRLFFNQVAMALSADGPAVEMLPLDGIEDRQAGASAPLRMMQLSDDSHAGTRAVLESLPLDAAWSDAAACATRLQQQLRQALPEIIAAGATFTLLDAGFYRFTRAYVFGHIACGGRQLPLALVMRNTEDGMVLDHIVLDDATIGAMFGRPRAPFQVELEQVAGSLAFLQSLTPATPVTALLASLGRAA